MSALSYRIRTRLEWGIVGLMISGFFIWASRELIASDDQILPLVGLLAMLAGSIVGPFLIITPPTRSLGLWLTKLRKPKRRNVPSSLQAEVLDASGEVVGHTTVREA